MAKKHISYLFSIFLFLIVIFLSSTTGFGEDIESLFNGLYLDLDEEIGSYSFLVAGHLYGAFEKGDPPLPSQSILVNIDVINKIGSKFFVLLGDNYLKADPLYISNFKKSFALEITVPLFNSVGNHDVTDRFLYEENFGTTYFDFSYGNELFVFLDTESGGNSQGQISGRKLTYLQDVLTGCSKRKEVKNIFIFSHKLIWAVDNPLYPALFSHLNAKSGYPATGYNFREEIRPYLLKLSAEGKSIYWLSGDIGGSSSYTLFYGRDPDYDITYLATGIGDTENDAIVKVDIGEDREVRFTPLSLTGQKMHAIENYDNTYWKNYFHRKKARKDRLKKLKYFSIGLLSGIGLFLIIFYARSLNNFKRFHKAGGRL